MDDVLIFLNHAQLQRHPRNMRRTYAAGDVRRMAVSQLERARRGEPACVQPLVVTPGPGVTYDPAVHTTLTIVAGHLRHAGNASLKASAPPLNCLVRHYATDADMVADMGTENGLRADPGVLAWAHYIHGELAAGVKMHTILQRTGLSLGRVRTLETLLQLASPVQQIVDQGQLALGAVEPLSRVVDPAAQVDLARELAERKATLQQVDLAVKAWLARQSGLTPAPKGRGRGRAASVPALEGVPATLPATARQVRQAARLACHQCGSDPRLDEPAWEIAVAAVEQTCNACDLRGFEVVCKSCPLAQAMRSVAEMVAAPRRRAAEVAA